MSLGNSIYSILQADTAVYSVVKENIRPVTLPQGAGFPAIIYNEISTEPNDTKAGVSTKDRINVQIDIYTETYTAAQDLATKVRTKLDRFSNVAIDLCVFTGQSDEGLQEEHRVFRIIQQYEFRLA